MVSNIAVLILAAGSASRMGKVKQLLPFDNSTFLEHAISQAIASKGNDVFCVLGANSNEIKAHIGTERVVFIDNLNWNEGLSASIVAGITHISSLNTSCEALLIMLADQPFVDFNYLDALIETYQKNKECIVASNYGTKKGVPAIFPKNSFEFLSKLKGDKGAKVLLNSDVFKVASITPNDRNTLRDIDTPSDYNGL